ncbi:MAG: hypothetical protein QW575_04745 [Thermoproteota archaeon]
MVKVDWIYRNYFPTYDTPAWLMVDTSGQTIKLKIYDSVTTYVDDTINSTTRTGQFMLQVWSTNPRGNIDNLITDILHVEIYDTSNKLIDKKTLSYVYGKAVKYISFYYPDGYSATPQGVWGGNFNGVPVFGDISGNTIGLPITSGLIETYSYSELRGGKFYYIGKIENVTDRITLIGPAERFDVTLRIRVTRDILGFLFDIPGFNYVADFIDYFFAQFIAQPMSYAHSLVAAIMNRLGINLPAKKIEVDGSDILVTYEQDIMWELVVVVVTGLIALHYIAQIVHDISVAITTQSQTDRDKAIAQTYQKVVQQQQQTLQQALQYASSIQDPTERDKAISQILSSPLVNPSNYISGLSTALQQASTCTQQTKQDNTLLYLAIGVAIVAMLVAISK